VKGEASLVAFTILLEAGLGTFLVARACGVGDEGPGELAALGAGVASGLALGISLLHLGSPSRAFLAWRNWRTSPLSREVVLVASFQAAWLAWASLSPRWSTTTPPIVRELVSWAAACLSLAAAASVGGVYHSTWVPAWRRVHTLATHVLTALLLGATTVAAATASNADASPGASRALAISVAAAVGVVALSPGETRALRAGEDVLRLLGMRTRSRWPRLMKLRALMVGLGGGGAMWLWCRHTPAPVPLVMIAIVFLAAELLGRSAFYSMGRPPLP
jgi:anaerobic dimethyl sulfoxide reductase subunit C